MTYQKYLGYFDEQKPDNSTIKVPKKSLKELITKEKFQKSIESYQEKEKKFDLVSSSNPKIWGPPFWYTLHNSSLYYPENPSQIVRERMKNRILAIPYELPCASCRQHAISFIENSRYKLEDVVSTKDKLFKFYVDFHNQVNLRNGKEELSYDDAKKIYSL